MTRIFLDATTLIALGTIGELEHLTSFAGDLVVLPAVQNEVTTEPAQTNLTRFIEQYEVETTDPVVDDHLQEAKEVLGEVEKIGDVYLIGAVLGYTADDLPIGIVSDDRRVRTTARGLGAIVTGTIGVVVRAVEDGLDREEAYTLVDRIDSHGLHMTGSLREKAYSLIDEAAEATSSDQ
jgi:predicted nucleic acid-binding protein